MNAITIGTSISPHNMEKQKRAVQSWIDAGFRVFSYNAMDEMALIQDCFPGIDFIAANRDARREKGRPLVYLYDILQQLKLTGGNVVGIINSDIHLRNINGATLAYLYDQAQNSLIYAHRHDVNSPCEKLGEPYIGLDFFLFDRCLIDIYQDDGLVLGGCAWDYYMVFVARLFGFDAKLLANPIAYHVRHTQTWSDWEDYNTKKRITRKYLGEASARAVRRMDDAVRNNTRSIFKADIESAASKSVLVLVPADLMNNGTLTSIQESAFANKHIVAGNVQTFDFSNADEDYVLIACDGIIYTVDFLPLALTYLNCGCDFVSFDLEIKREGEFFCFVYSNELEQTESLLKGCTVYRRDWLCSNNSKTNPVSARPGGRVASMDYSCYLRHTLLDRGKMYFYGGGMNCRYILQNCGLPKGLAAGILDSNPAIHGTRICGIPVSGISEIFGKNDVSVFITALEYEYSIYEMLKTCLPKERIIRSFYVHEPDQKPVLENVLPFFDIVLIGNSRERELFKQRVQNIYDVFYVDEIDECMLTEAYILERKNTAGEMTYYVAVSGNINLMRAVFMRVSSTYSGYFLSEEDFFTAISKSKLVCLPQIR